MQTEQLQVTTPDRDFGVLPIILCVFCMLPFLTGAADLLWGTKILELGGAVLPQQVISDPTFNNQVKFWGAIWFGYGAALWWTSSRLRSDTVMFRILIGTLFLSGVKLISGGDSGDGLQNRTRKFPHIRLLNELVIDIHTPPCPSQLDARKRTWPSDSETVKTEILF